MRAVSQPPVPGVVRRVGRFEVARLPERIESVQIRLQEPQAEASPATGRTGGQEAEIEVLTRGSGFVEAVDDPEQLLRAPRPEEFGGERGNSSISDGVSSSAPGGNQTATASAPSTADVQG